MAQCVSFADQGASAPAVLVAAPEPCTTFVLVTPAEYAAQASNPFVLTPEDGLLISAAIVGVWAAAFSWRAAIRALGTNDGDSST